MILALAAGNEINALMRAEILGALKSVMVRQRNDELRSARGRPIALHTFNAASLAKVLVDNHLAKSVEAATAAAYESVKYHMGLTTTEITLDAVRRAYRKINASPDGSITTSKGDKILSGGFSPNYIADAAARLPKPSRSGNK
jgi:hypothetical protein